MKDTNKTILLLFIVFFLLPFLGFIRSAIAEEPCNKAVIEKTDAAAKTALLPVRFYQKHLSPVLGGRCPMYPSCSHYAVDAIEKHGAVMGWFMACDRLMRCGRDEVLLAPTVYVDHSPRAYDTVEENDFWLK